MMGDPTCPEPAFLDRLGVSGWAPGLLRLLVRGEPVTLVEAAVAIGEPVERVEALLRGQPGTDWDAEGRLIGFGLTQRPTAHRFVVDGRVLYTWCAMDTLIFPALLGASASVASTCPATGEPVRFDVGAHDVTGLTPSTAVISQPPTAGPMSDFRTTVCDHGHFFAWLEAASGWLDEHPDGRIAAVAQAFAAARSDITVEARCTC